jgi:RimJ/RimL family protein N-acetyltransferase
MHEIVGIAGDRVRLLPLEKDRHLANYVRWFNDPEVTRYLNRVTPLSRLEEEAFFEAAAKAKDMIVWAIHDETDRHIGGTGLHAIDWQGRSAVSGTVIGDRSVWGHGYGSEVMALRTKWAFEELGLHRIESECFADNIASARCLEKAGYRQIGVARQRRWRQGRWHDCILWEILDADYFGAKEPQVG